MLNEGNRSEVDFVEKVKTLASSVGTAAVVLIILHILNWIIFVLRTTECLEGAPTWIIPSADVYLSWILMLKLFTLIVIIIWLIAFLWYKKLRPK